MIAVDSSAQAQDFVLESAPYRVVLDLTGAKLGVAPRFYDRVARGGITNVRYAQYRAGVVRVVIELDGPHDYNVVRTPHEMRLAVEGGNASFTAWDTAARAAARRQRARSATAVAERQRTPCRPEPAQRGRAGDPARRTWSRRPQAPSPMRRASDAITFLQRGTQSSQPRITVTYQDSDIRDVLAAFAAFSGRTIVVGKDVQGTVTAEVRDQPWDVALQSILASQQLAASEDQYGIITVDSYKNIQAKQASEPLVTQLVSLNYANAVGLVTTVQSLLARDCGPGQRRPRRRRDPAQSQAASRAGMWSPTPGPTRC